MDTTGSKLDSSGHGIELILAELHICFSRWQLPLPLALEVFIDHDREQEKCGGPPLVLRENEVVFRPISVCLVTVVRANNNGGLVFRFCSDISDSDQ